MKKLFLFLLFSSVLASCDPLINVDFNVKNDSGKSIMVILSKDTSLIENGSEKTIYHESDIGSTDEFIDNLEFLPFDTLFISNDSAQLYNKDPMDADRWTKTKPKKKSGLGTVVLTIVPDDFE